MNRTFIDNLNDLCRNLDYIFDINSGGCCYVASVLGHLCERYHLQYRLVIADDCGCFDDELFKRCIENQDLATCSGLGDDTCFHYYLQIMDSTVNSMDCEDLDLHYFDVDSDDITWIYVHGRWNHVFDKQYCPIIRKTLVKFFDENFQKRK